MPYVVFVVFVVLKGPKKQIQIIKADNLQYFVFIESYFLFIEDWHMCVAVQIKEITFALHFHDFGIRVCEVRGLMEVLTAFKHRMFYVLTQIESPHKYDHNYI